MSETDRLHSSRRLEFNVHLDLEEAPAYASKEERSLFNDNLVRCESRVEMVSDFLNIFLSLFFVSIQRYKHSPTVIVLMFGTRVSRLRVFYITVGVTESKSDRLFVTAPLTCFNELLFFLFELLTEILLDFFLEIFVNDWDE